MASWRLTERPGRTNWRMRSDPREGAVRVGIASVADLGEAGGFAGTTRLTTRRLDKWAVDLGLV